MITRRWKARLGRTRWIASVEPFRSYCTARLKSITFVRRRIWGREGDPQVLSTDVAGGVLWLDTDDNNHRQIILPDGSLARNSEWWLSGERQGPRPTECLLLRRV